MNATAVRPYETLENTMNKPHKYPTRHTPSPRWATALTAISLAALLSACGGGSDTMATPMGTLRLALTDAPTCGYDHVYVSIQKIRVHQSNTASDTDAGWSDVVLSPTRRVDLLTLTNGVLSELGQTSLPSGKYTQMRLQLAANDAGTPMANSVTPTGGTETALATPSASQTGLKLNVDVTVGADQVADLVLDFDACRSVVKLGNSGNYNLKPVVSVTPRVSDAANRVIGYVSPALGSSTTVSAQLNGVPIKSTVPDSTGKFVLTPLTAGTYDVVVSAAGRASATVTGVPVSSTANTTLNASTTPIDPPTSAMHVVSGSVILAPAVTPIDALVVARKTFAAGPTIEVAAKPVDGVTGAFSFALPSAAPVKMAYAAGTSTLVFSADSSVPTGKYSLVATSGTSVKTLPVDLSLSDVTALNFSFP